MQFNTIFFAAIATLLALPASALAQERTPEDLHDCCIGYSQDNQQIYNECTANPADFAC